MKAEALKKRFGSPNVIDEDLPYSTRLLPPAQWANNHGLLQCAKVLAQGLFDRHQPSVIVASSLGGAVALALDARKTPMVLIAPVWNTALSTEGLLQPLSISPGEFGASHAAIASTMRRLAEELAGARVPRTAPPLTLIVHSRNDRTLGLEQSAALLGNSPVTPGHPSAHRMDNVVEMLRDAGYCNQRCSYADIPNDGRLIVIGRSHECNDPDPDDTGNRDPHPHNAIITAVELLIR